MSKTKTLNLNFSPERQEFRRATLVGDDGYRLQNNSNAWIENSSFTSVKSPNFAAYCFRLVSDFNSLPVHCITPFRSDPLVSPPNLSPPCFLPTGWAPTSFPGFLFFPHAPGGGKKRDPGNEIGWALIRGGRLFEVGAYSWWALIRGGRLFVVGASVFAVGA